MEYSFCNQTSNRILLPDRRWTAAMVQSNMLPVQRVDDETWRRELCPDCGTRLLGFREWREHGPRAGWGGGWVAGAGTGRPAGGNVRRDPARPPGEAGSFSLPTR